MEIFEYTFFQNAILGSLLASILCGIVGTYIVTRRLVFISGGITHASFGGIGLGVYLGFNPILSAMVFSVLCACGVQWMSHRGNIREDSTIAFFWTLGMSVGIICCFLSPGFMPDLNSYLFGSILTIGLPDILLLAVLTLVVALLFACLFRSIVSVAFDPIFARSQRLPVDLIEYLMMGIIALTIVATLRMVGIVLAISLLTVPQMTANVFTYSYKRMIMLSIVIGWADCLLGLGISYALNVPSGASIIFVGIVVYAVAKIAKAAFTSLCRRFSHSQMRHLTILLAVGTLLSACSTQKNTASSRWWHAFNARYNTYYNGSQAYIDGALEKENGNKDNYTELLPLYTVGNKASRDLGKGNFETAVTKSEKAIHQHSIKRRPIWDKRRRKTAKDIEWLGRREYNPFLWKAWMLMGRAQFHMGEFADAASTFSYMSRLYATQPAIYGKARAWLAKSYIEEGWLYDAEDVIRNMKRDSMDWRAVKEWDYTYADYFIHANDYDRAIPYVRKVIRHEMRRKQKAREWYLLGQLYAAVGKRDSAYRAFRHVVGMNPPYELEFNARIAQTEVMAQGQQRRMIGKLKRMAANDNNKDYLEQVYYAIGNIYLSDHDTLQAIHAYETGNERATRNGIEKGVLLLRLGDLYWAREQFSDAKRCYGEAIGLLDKERKDYEQLSYRSKVLDELVPYTEAIHLQDSLQTLSKLDEKARNAAIDRVIDALKKKEKEERRAAGESEAQQMQSQNAGTGNANNGAQTANNGNQGNSTLWYFYNQMAVNQGKATFQKLWGKRENVDNWQRINKTVVATPVGVEEMTDEVRDSLAKAAVKADSLKNIADSAQNNPHKREYYLAQIPFTPEQLAASDAIIMDGLYQAGVIFKDKLNHLALSEKHLLRLVGQYPAYDHLDDAYYHLFLLYMRRGDEQTADLYLQRLKKDYPNSTWTSLLADPHYAENARMGVHMEDSLYTATYAAFKADRFGEVAANNRLSATRFPLGANRDKFIFIGGLTKLNAGDANGCLDDMETLVKQFPQSQLSEMAGMIINGVNAGRKLKGGKFDLSNVWSQRANVLADSDSIAKRTFIADRDVPFHFLIVYNPDSLNENQLLFELARFNFTNFLVRNFEITITDADGMHRMLVSGFRNYDEALQYARQFYRQTAIQRQLRGHRTLLIGDANMDLIGNPFSYDDYDDFYSKHFAPLKVSTFRLLTEPEEITTEPAAAPTIEEIDKALDTGTVIEDIPDTSSKEQLGTMVPITDDKAEEAKEEKGTVIPITETTAPEKTNGTVIALPATPIDSTKAKAEPKGVIVKEPTATKATPKDATTEKKGVTVSTKATPAQKTTTPVQKTATPVQKKDTTKVSKTGIYFRDGSGKAAADTTKTKKGVASAKKKDKKNFDLEDEYYDLEGF